LNLTKNIFGHNLFYPFRVLNGIVRFLPKALPLGWVIIGFQPNGNGMYHNCFNPRPLRDEKPQQKNPTFSRRICWDFYLTGWL